MTQAQATNREPTMEEILASIRRIIEDNNVPEPVDVPDFQPNASTPSARPEMSASVVSDFEREFAQADVFSKPVQETIVAQEASNTYGQARIEPSISFESALETPAVQINERPAAFHELRPIISEAASRQVAKSFEHLTVALHEERNTSVAELTEEMVRPMLQDWLDNNLPTLVERLVREEIERVSRGSR